MEKTGHEKIFEIRQTITPELLNDITSRIMEGELSGHEFDNTQLRFSLSSLVPEYDRLEKDTAEPIVLKVKPEILA